MAPPPSPRRVNIPPLHELRFELEKGEACSIKLVNGSAEIFGFDLLPYIEHPLGDEVRAAVFSWTGAEVEMSLLPF
jgi:polyribonucleotide 5'-hydroxyl-kinase